MAKVTVEFWPLSRHTVEIPRSAQALKKNPPLALCLVVQQLEYWPGESEHTSHGISMRAWVRRIEDDNGNVIFSAEDEQ